MEIIAELYFRDGDKPVYCWLLGKDNNLYYHNDLWHHVRPFSQEGKRIADTGHTLEYMLEHSITEYKDGRKERGIGYYGGRQTD